MKQITPFLLLMVLWGSPLYGHWVQHIVDASIVQPALVEVADLDGDGDIDAVATSFSEDKVLWYENDKLNWRKRTVDGFLDGAVGLFITDLDGDRALDILAAGNNANEVVWYRNRGGTPLTWEKQVIDGTLAGAEFLIAADLDGDGDMDIIATAVRADQVVWYENDLPAPWVRRVIDPSLDGAMCADVGDFDYDGDLDVVATGTDADVVNWYQSDGGAPLSWTKRTVDGFLDGAWGVRALDERVIAAGRNASVVVCYGNENAGQGWPEFLIDVDLDGAMCLDIADLDMDGIRDVVVTGRDANTVMAYCRDYHTYPAGWRRDTIASSLSGANYVCAGDIDGDLDNDVFVTAWNGNTIVWYENPAPTPPWLTYRTTNSGLPSDMIFSIAIDDSDVRWIASHEYTGFGSHSGSGLTRFDGNTWVVYDTMNSGIPGNSVVGTALDSQGNIWVAIEDYWTGDDLLPQGSVARFDGADWTVYNSANTALPTTAVACIAVDGFDTVWVGTEEGLVRYDGLSWEVFDTSNSILPSNNVLCVTVDESNTKWVGTAEGLVEIDGSDWTMQNSTNSTLPGDWIRCVAADSSGHLWVGGPWGLAESEGSTWIHYSAETSELPTNEVTCIAIDRSHTAWVGTTSYGVVTFNGSLWRTYTRSNSSLGDNDVHSMTVDKHGTIWVGTRFGLSASTDKIVSSVGEGGDAGATGRVPGTVALRQNFPNPFNPGTEIRFAIPRAGFVTLTVFNVLGEEVALLASGDHPAGEFSITWDASGLPSGVYFYRLAAGDYVQTRKALLMR